MRLRNYLFFFVAVGVVAVFILAMIFIQENTPAFPSSHPNLP